MRLNVNMQNLVAHEPENGTYGDCVRMCVACVIGEDPLSVPHFFRDGCTGPAGVKRMRSFLASRGLAVAVIGYPEEQTLAGLLDNLKTNFEGVAVILTGQSGRGDWGHSVVALDGEIVMDPTGSGLSGPLDGFWYVEIITPFSYIVRNMK